MLKWNVFYRDGLEVINKDFHCCYDAAKFLQEQFHTDEQVQLWLTAYLDGVFNSRDLACHLEQRHIQVVVYKR